MALVSLSALIIDDDANRRQRLQTALAAVPRFTKVYSARAPEEALDKLDSATSIDVVLLTRKVSAANFFFLKNELNRLGHDVGAAYIAVIEGSEAEVFTANRAYAEGYSGVLSDPFSVQKLDEVIALAARAKDEFKRRAIDRVVRGLISDIISQCRVVCQLVQCGFRESREMARLRTLSEKLRGLSPSELERYFELVVEEFVKEEPTPEVPPIYIYDGASRRLRERIEAKLIAYLEAAQQGRR